MFSMRYMQISVRVELLIQVVRIREITVIQKTASPCPVNMLRGDNFDNIEQVTRFILFELVGFV